MTAESLDPVLLRTFLAVTDQASFSRAAEQLGLSQPTVSQHVRRLEEACGRQLVARDTRSVRPTDNGEAMAGFARTILAANDEAISYFRGSAMTGRLRFGAADELALSELPTILRDFRQLYPRINLELTVTQSGVLIRRLAANQLDLIFVNQEADADRGRLVRRDRLVWVGLEKTELDEGAPVPLIAYPRRRASAARPRSTPSEAAGRTLADHLQHPRDQRRAGRGPGRHRDLRAGPEPGPGRICGP